MSVLKGKGVSNHNHQSNVSEDQLADDWDQWHKHYDRSAPLQARLRLVREQIRVALNECAPGPIRVVSACAGDGRDLLAAMSDHARRDDVQARLLDTNGSALRRGKAMATAAGVERQAEFVDGDAGVCSSYAGIAPVDLLLVSGVLGHLRHQDVAQFIQSLPTLCRRGANVIWNRHLVLNDGAVQAPLIRQHLFRAGFEELHHEITSGQGFAIGRARFMGDPQPLNPDQRLFEFVGVNILDPKGRAPQKRKSLWRKAVAAWQGRGRP